jgi:hypothetical protein
MYNNPDCKKISFMLHPVLSLLLFITSLKTLVNLSHSEYLNMYKIGQNWNRGAFTKIKTSNTTCSSEEQPLIVNPWPGTVNGCYCDLNLGITRPSLSPQSCGKGALLCKSVLSNPAVAYQLWKNTHLCGTRSSETYLKFKISSSAQGCPFNTRSCGIIDTLKNYICVNTKYPCPINRFLKLDASSPIPSDFNYSLISLSGGIKYLFSNEETRGYILSEFFLSENEPCTNPAFAD